MKRNKLYIVKDIAGETVIVPTGNAIENFNGLISTNEVAGFIWKNVEECETPDDMVKKVMDAYEGDPETIKKEVLEFLETLRKVGMIAY
nr:PqqD family protein [uncultured Merdimonas sp.]